MPPEIPVATYRLQLTKDFGFDAAARLVPYLRTLGISHVYASPFLTARAGSTHGYDIVDHNALNPELGGDESFARLSAALKEAGLGLILDFVPNHMAVGNANAWWLDVLEWGPRSPYAATFDIAWDLLPHRRGAGILLPILGRPYGDALADGEIDLRYDADEGSFSAWYFDHRLPINPQRYSDILRTVVSAAGAETADAGQALLAIASDYGRPQTPSYRQAPDLKARLSSIAGAREVIERGLSAYRAGGENGVNRLHRLLERQSYRLAYWRLAPSTINYRRFFDVNELAGIRVEHLGTFREVHRLVLQLVAAGELHGLRLDHIDGLADPAQYARRLHRVIDRVRGRPRRPLYTVMEKILAEDEPAPAFEGMAGTTGYEWLNLLSRLLVREEGRAALDRAWREIDHRGFPAVLEASKARIIGTIMASEFNVLAELLARIAAGHLSTRDFSPASLRGALRLFVIEFPVYRTYVTDAGCSARDHAIIADTIGRARRRWQGSDVAIFDFLQDAITLGLLRSDRNYSHTRLRQFAFKLQQFTGPVMAKSLEDTAFYRYHSLLALNEVGGHPTAPGVTVAAFHQRLAQRAAASPHGLTATATHDTKRGEDARMRILALSELSGEWAAAVAEWRTLNASLAQQVDGVRSPSAAHEYMLYQTLIGSWPGDRLDDWATRVADYAVKAAREGKEQTSWISPDERYEAGLRAFAAAVLDPQRSERFLSSFTGLARRVALLGALNSLALLTLKIMMPGVPDFYQGTEFWDLSLVDPDNRRPVDFAARADALRPAADMRDLMQDWPSGHIKLALTQRLLSLRHEQRLLFERVAYVPVEVSGPDREHVIAFMRTYRQRRILVVAGRHFADATDGGRHWTGADWRAHLSLPAGAGPWIDMLDARPALETADLGSLLRFLPVAVLMGR